MERAVRQTVRPGDARFGWQRRVANTLAVTFDIGVRRLYPVEVRGLEHFSGAPSTLVVSNHRRDSDGPIIASVLLQRQGLRMRGVLPAFVAREDMFRRGFLCEYLEGWPAPFRMALSALNLSSFLSFMGAFPMRRVPERSLREVLEEVLHLAGNLPLDNVLKPAWVERFERLSTGGHHPLHVKDVLTWRYHELLSCQHGLSKLQRSLFRELLPYERSIIESQLQYFTRLLEQGDTLVLEPEGVVSVDGRFARLRGALHALLNRPQAGLRVLPLGITYDSMTRGRERIFVNIGPEICDLQGLSRKATDERIAAAIRSQLTVTCSQLASQFLFEAGKGGEMLVSESELDDYVHQQADRYAGEGCHVDPRLLASARRKRRLEGYIASCLKNGILRPYGDGRYCIVRASDREETHVSPPDSILRYMNNELSASALSTVPRSPPGRVFP